MAGSKPVPFFIKQGVAEGELTDTERGRRYFVRRYMDREMRRAYESLRSTFHIAGYYEDIVEFEDMPEYFDEIKEFIEQIALGDAQDTTQE